MQLYLSSKMFFPLLLALGVLSVRGDGCTLGRPNLPQTSPNPTPGLFIDRENPSICSGQITDWRICYYNPRNFNSRDTIRILLQTWRISDNRGSRISSYPTTLRIPQQPAIFQCVNISVDPTDYIDVEQGDFIAVYLFQDEVLPVIANRNDLSRVCFFPAGNNVPNAIEPSLPGLVSLSNQAIHISATIGKLIQFFSRKSHFFIVCIYLRHSRCSNRHHYGATSNVNWAEFWSSGCNCNCAADGDCSVTICHGRWSVVYKKISEG